MSTLEAFDKPASGEKFLLQIDDGNDESCWVKSVSGGDLKAGIIKEKYSRDAGGFAHVAKYEIQAFDIELGMAASWSVMSWIQDSWARRQYSRRNGSVVRTNLCYEIDTEYWFYHALIEEVTLPALDGSDNKSAYLNIKIRPEEMETKKPGGGKVKSSAEERQRLWSPSQFRLSIDGVDCTRVQKIGSLSIKQSIAQVHPGIARSPEIEPTGIEFPMLTLTMPLSGAGNFITWHDDAVLKGKDAPVVEKSATLEYLDQSRNTVLFSIKMEGVSIHALKYSKAEGQSNTLQTVDVELYVDVMELVRGAGMAHEAQVMAR